MYSLKTRRLLRETKVSYSFSYTWSQWLFPCISYIVKYFTIWCYIFPWTISFPLEVLGPCHYPTKHQGREVESSAQKVTETLLHMLKYAHYFLPHWNIDTLVCIYCCMFVLVCLTANINCNDCCSWESRDREWKYKPNHTKVIHSLCIVSSHIYCFL